MKIIGKEFRHIKSCPSIQENDVQGTLYSEYLWGYIYIYDNKTVARWSSVDRDDSLIDIFGKIPNDLSNIRKKNIISSIQKGNDPVTIGNYKISDNNRIRMKWNFYHGGEILLNGDAVKGTFYKNGEINVPERVYYNIDKPLPENLIEEQKNA